MSADHNPTAPLARKMGNDMLNSVVNFGTDADSPEVHKDNATRIKRIIKKLQDISRRLDYLASHM